MAIGTVLAALQTSDAGLSLSQAQERLQTYGPNQIGRKQKNGVLRLLWRQINNSLIWVLLGSGLLAVALGKMTDGLVVLAVVLINAVIGFIQEFKAGRAIEALSDMVVQNTTVIREGKALRLPLSTSYPAMWSC